MNVEDIALPGNWPDLVRRAMLHAVSLAHVGITCAWSRAADSGLQNVRLKAKLDKLQTELARKDNQLNIIKSRMSRVPAKKRPYYLPNERMRILNHKAACNWNLKQTAEAFQTDPATIASWMKRIDDDSLINIPVPWNKYPAYLRYAVRQFKALVPRLGKKKIAEYFTRSGLYLAASTIGRYIKSDLPDKPPETEGFELNDKTREIKSHHPFQPAAGSGLHGCRILCRNVGRSAGGLR
jgi:hypothetical protein